MAESRDRLVRPVDIAASFARRRSGALGVLLDEGGRGPLIPETPTQMRTPGVIGPGRGVTARGRGGTGRVALGTPRTAARGRILYATPSTGRENTPMTGGPGRGRGMGRPMGSVLPSWYPRTPLRDVTPVMRALQRRRSRLGETEGHESGNTLQLGPIQLSGALPEHGASLVTPSATVEKKQCPPSVGKVPKILSNITNKPVENYGSEFLTPQKQLLIQIDTVEKEVMDELRKLKRTPTARRAERDKRVRTLLSMR